MRHVECFWMFETGAIDETSPPHIIVPDGTVSISCVFLPGGQNFVGMSGPSLVAHRTTLIPHTKYAGIRIRAGAAGSILKTGISRFRDIFGPVMPPIPQAIQIMMDHAGECDASSGILPMMQRAAEAIVDSALPLDEAVHDYCAEIMRRGGQGALAEIAQNASVSIRQLRRKFSYQCGLSAKEFARLRRVRQACLLMFDDPASNTALAAMQAGFADQSHMTREFSDIFGNSAKLVTDYLQQISHGSLVRENM